jgi:hypothetical protein
MSLLNENFRDLAATANYPFTEESTLMVQQFPVFANCFLDMMVYPVGSYTLPYYLASFSALDTAGLLTVTIKDSSGLSIGSFTTQPDDSATDCVHIISETGLVVGMVVYTPTELAKLRNQLRGISLELGTEAFELLPSQTPARAVQGTVGIYAADTLFSQNATLCAAGGFHFTAEAGAYRLDMYGELPTTRMPIKSINGVTAEHFWLSAHPDSALRVITGTDIFIGKGKDLAIATQ